MAQLDTGNNSHMTLIPVCVHSAQMGSLGPRAVYVAEFCVFSFSVHMAGLLLHAADRTGYRPRYWSAVQSVSNHVSYHTTLLTSSR